MAGKRNTSARTRAQRWRKAARATEAQRADVRINTAQTDDQDRLPHLMIAQRRVPSGFETIYRASHAEFVRAGLPPVVLQQPTSRTGYAFRLDDHDALLIKRGSMLELTLQWGEAGPWQAGEAHPALFEISRNVWFSAQQWLQDFRRFPEGPEYGLVETDRLLDAGCTYYRGPRSRKYRFHLKDLENLNTFLHSFTHAIKLAGFSLVEPPVLPKPRKPRAPSPAKRARLTASAKEDRTLQSVLASAARAAEKRTRKGIGGRAAL